MNLIRLIGGTIMAIVVVRSAAQQPTFRSSGSIVRLEVSVTDDHGAVQGLRAKDFLVVDSGVTQVVSVEELTDVPLDLVLTAQPIASIAYTSPEQAARMNDGLAAFMTQIEDRDRLAVILASAPPSRLRAMQFGKPHIDLHAFDGHVDAAPFDAITAALGEFVPSDRRRALVAFVNGTDFRSTVNFEGVAAQTRRPGPAFVLVGSPLKLDQHAYAKVETPGGRIIGESTAKVSGYVFPATLKLLARRTGGITVNLGSAAPKDVMRETFAWLRKQYLIAYQAPPGQGWHPTKVTVNRRGVTVTTREGYMSDGK